MNKCGYCQKAHKQAEFNRQLLFDLETPKALITSVNYEFPLPSIGLQNAIDDVQKKVWDELKARSESQSKNT